MEDKEVFRMRRPLLPQWVGLGATSLSVEVAGAGCVELTKNSEK